MIDFVPKLKLQLAVQDHQRDTVLDPITRAANAGKIGDGKIFVNDLVQVVRIRTGEQGAEAI